MELFSNFFKGMGTVLVPELGFFFGALVAMLMLVILLFSIVGCFGMLVDFLLSGGKKSQ